MDSLIVLVAKDGIFVVALVAAIAWLLAARSAKIPFAVQAVVALLLTAVGIRVAAALHTDPRPFVVDPSVHPLFTHPADNGFPSDHTAVGVATALVVLSWRRTWGAWLVVLAVAVGIARVLAHVHHPEDILGGALIAVLAWLVSVAAVSRLRQSRQPREVTAVERR